MLLESSSCFLSRNTDIRSCIHLSVCPSLCLSHAAGIELITEPIITHITQSTLHCSYNGGRPSKEAEYVG